jgi:hypothetical protein
LRDRMGESRLGDPEPLGGTREMTRTAQFEGASQLANIHN